MAPNEQKKKLQEAYDLITKVYEAREEIYADRSEERQESDIGLEYEQMTEYLANAKSELENALMS